MVGASVGANLADRYVAAASSDPTRDAIVVVGDEPRRLTHGELCARVESVAAALHGRGVRAGDRVGVLLANGNEHIEVLLASFLLRAVPVNLSVRDNSDANRQILETSGALVVVHEPDTDLSMPMSIARGDDYERALSTAPPLPSVSGRSGDDHYVLYTGGSTGAPKGVLWRHDDLYHGALAALAQRPVRCLPASPFAHGTGQWMALSTLLHGGTVVCRRDRSFDPEATLDAVDAASVSYLVVVGDAFARPIADLLEACPGRWSLASLTTLLSGGASLSPEVKEQLLAALPTALVVDGFGASETGGNGRMVSVAGAVHDGPPRFACDDDVAVLGTDLRPLPAGDERIGSLARRGHIPLGYVDDDDATQRTFPCVDGVRWALSGDRARHEADGTITVLGRGTSTINTGGHKVQAEEIERCLRTHPAVLDALVIGTPDERFGERVTAIVAPRHDARPTLDALKQHCRARLPDHKVPRRLVVVERVQRSEAGKPDYSWARAVVGR